MPPSRLRTICWGAISFALLLLVFSPESVQAQQNLFSVPTGEITAAGKVYLQEQINFTNVGSSNTTLDFGLGDRWEAGLNFSDAIFYDNSTGPSSGQVNPDLLLNIQKGFELADSWSAGVGTQAGFNPSRDPNDIEFINFSWLIAAYEAPGDRGKYYLGAYYANRAFRGDGRPFGFMLGAEIPIVKDKLHFMADFLSGVSDISTTVVGGVVMLPRNWQFSAGAQFPSPGSENSYGCILGLSQADLLQSFHRQAPEEDSKAD